MGQRRCCIVTCPNKNSKEKSVTLFRVPKENTEKFVKWSSILACIGIKINHTNYICENHFKKDEIHDKVVKTDQFGNIIFTRKLSTKTLTPNAVPCFVNSDKDPSVMLLIENSNTGVQTLDVSEEPMDIENEISNTENLNVTNPDNDSEDFFDETPTNFDQENSSADSSNTDDLLNDVYQSEAQIDHVSETTTLGKNSSTEYININDLLSDHQYILDSTTLRQRREIFDSICNKTINLNVPNDKWGIIRNKECGYIGLQEGIAAPIEKYKSMPLIFQKQVIIDTQLNVRIYFWDKLYASHTNISSVADLENIILNANAEKLCSGGPTCKEYKNATPRCAYKDNSGYWRHNLCTLAVQKTENACKHCHSLHNTLLQHIIRKANRQEIHRVHLG